VFGDAGYPGIEKRQENPELPVTWHIAMRPSKRKALPKTTAGELMGSLNMQKSAFAPRLSIPFML